MKPKTLAYYAKDDRALRSGSFYRQAQLTKTKVLFAQFSQGSYLGSSPNPPPEGLTEFSPVHGDALIPECFEFVPEVAE